MKTQDTILDIMKMPTLTSELPKELGVKNTKIHESCFRCYQILQRVKYYLSEGMPQNLILDLINDMDVSKKEL